MTSSKPFKILFQMVNDGKLTEEELAEFIKGVASDGLKEAGGHICTLPSDIRDEVSHIEIALKTIGEGNISKGVERIRENHQFVSSLRKVRNRIGNMVLGFLVLGVMSGILYVFKDFFKQLVK